MEQVGTDELTLGREFDLGTTVLSEDDIIAFAERFDPLPFHTDREAAKASIFGKLVSSGPHLFNHVYQQSWIPRFGHSVLAGLEINNWRFMQPVGANQPISSMLTVTGIQRNPEKRHAAITWKFVFRDVATGKQAQQVEMTVLHRL